MNPRAATFVLIVVGSILAAGTLSAIFAASHGISGGVAVVFDSSTQTSQPAVEPLFPGLPAR